jgi:hypothetical protein
VGEAERRRIRTAVLSNRSVCAIWMIRGAGLWIYAGPGA